MGTICAWCNRWIERVAAPRPVARHDAQSHGICPACLQKQLAEVRRSVPLRAA